MSAPDPETVAAGGAAVGGAWAFWKWLDSKFSKKADKANVAKAIEEVREELGTQRGHIAKVFDQMRENEQRAQDRHERLLDAVHSRK